MSKLQGPNGKESPLPRNGAASFPFIVFFLQKQRKLPVRKKIQNATRDGQLKRRKRGPMWSTKGPKPIMLPLPIRSHTYPPPTV